MNEMNKIGLISAMFILVSATMQMMAQSVSVSPSRLYFKELPGGFKSQKIRVTNNGTKSETFQLGFNDFASDGNKGKTQIVKGEDNLRGCSQWLSASPSFFELAPGVTQDVEILMQVPNTPEAKNARWAVAAVKLAREKTGSGEKGSDVTGMQILQTFQFLIHIFQTPPTVTYKEANVLSFTRLSTSQDSVQVLSMEVENAGETILDCAPYLDVVNLNTGESKRIRNRAFSVLPEGRRAIRFTLPGDLAKGKYSILGVIDYGSDSDLAGAELTIDIE